MNFAARTGKSCERSWYEGTRKPSVLNGLKTVRAESPKYPTLSAQWRSHVAGQCDGFTAFSEPNRTVASGMSRCITWGNASACRYEVGENYM